MTRRCGLVNMKWSRVALLLSTLCLGAVLVVWSDKDVQDILYGTNNDKVEIVSERIDLVRSAAASAVDAPSTGAKTTRSLRPGLTIIVKTMGDTQRVLVLCKEIRHFYPSVDILIGDDGQSAIPADAKAHLARLKVKYFILPLDAGASVTRNYLMDRTETEFFCTVDDDYIFTEHTRLETLMDTLKQNPSLVLAGGAVSDRVDLCARMVIEDTILLLVPDYHAKLKGGCLVCDFIAQFFVGRTEMLQQVRWDDQLKTGEHEELFLRLREKFPYSAGFCPSVNVGHKQRSWNERKSSRVGNNTYMELRDRGIKYINISLAQHGLTGIGYEIGEKIIAHGDVGTERVSFLLQKHRSSGVVIDESEALFPPRCSSKAVRSVVHKDSLKKWCEDISLWTFEDIPEVELFINAPDFKILARERTEIYRISQAILRMHSAMAREKFEYQNFVRAERRVDPLHGTEWQIRMRVRPQDGESSAREETFVMMETIEKKNAVFVQLQQSEATRVNFVVPIFNAFERLQRLVENVRRMSPEPRLVIVDYGSTDGNVNQLLKKSGVDHLFIDIRGQKFSRAGGLQAGINAVSNSELIFTLDADIDMPANLVSVIHRHVVKGKQIFAPVVFSFYKGHDKISLKAKGYWNPSYNVDKHGWWRREGFGMIAAYKSDVLFVGGFDLMKFQDKWGGEDIDLVTRMMHSGYKIWRSLEPNYYHNFHPRTAWGGHVNAQVPLKIFVYDLPEEFNVAPLALNQAHLHDWPQKYKMGRDEWDCTKSMFSIEVKFHQMLLKSPFVTTEAAEADLFYVPIYSVCLLNHNLPLNASYSAIQHNHAVKWISEKFPFWNRTLGTDHIFVLAQGLARNLLGNDNGLGNTIALTVNSDLSPPPKTMKHAFYHPWNDIAIPPFLHDMTQFTNVDHSQRNYKVFFSGSIKPWNLAYSKGVRQYIAKHYANQTNWYVHQRTTNLSPELRGQFVSAIRHSVFCICPEGLFAYTPRITESILSGCIPVLMSESLVHPFSNLIDFSTFTVQLAPSDVTRLPQLLSEISESEIRAKQRVIQSIAPMFLYHDTPIPGDAFYSIMDQLAAKKLPIKQPTAN